VTALADPRCFAATTSDPAVGLAATWVKAASAPQRDWASPELEAWLRIRVAEGRDEEIVRSLHAATSPAVYRCLWDSLDRALSPDPGAGVVALPFAFPLLIVTGGRAPVTLSGVLRDIGRVRGALEASGVLGQVSNFGLGNALCSLPALESVQPSRLYALAREIFPGVLDLPPTDISVTTSDEQVHCASCSARSLPAHAPTFLETGSAIATWEWRLPASCPIASGGGAVRASDSRPPATLLRAQSWAGVRARTWRSRPLSAARCGDSAPSSVSRT
jgi:hypothetical protein